MKALFHHRIKIPQTHPLTPAGFARYPISGVLQNATASAALLKVCSGHFLTRPPEDL